jgi:hypothetical protein
LDIVGYKVARLVIPGALSPLHAIRVTFTIKHSRYDSAAQMNTVHSTVTNSSRAMAFSPAGEQKDQYDDDHRETNVLKSETETSQKLRDH